MLAMQSNIGTWKLNAQIERLLQSMMVIIHRRIMLLHRVTLPRGSFTHKSHFATSPQKALCNESLAL
jgi:hypothetical protein